MATHLHTAEQITGRKQSPGWFPALFRQMDRMEAPIVLRVASFSRRLSLFQFSVWVNRLANGWMYLLIALLLILLKGWHLWRLAAASLISVGLGQILFAYIKPKLARLRPCDAEPALSCREKPLDRYSFPSGHIMTAVSVAIPLGWAFPWAIPAMILVVALVGWARLSLAHHYPTDLIVGCIVGASISLVVTAFFF
jgi:undecaprenyl-diphosphatase